MSCAIALAINLELFSSIESTFDSIYLRDLYETEIPVGSEDMSTLMKNIGKCVSTTFSNAASGDTTT